MKKLKIKNLYAYIGVLIGLTLGVNWFTPSRILAEKQNFEPTWDVIEIDQGPYSENLEASQFFTSALYFYFNGNLEDAAYAFQAALSVDPNISTAYYLLGNTLYQQGRIEEAIVQYYKAIEANPFVPKVYNNLGTALASQGKHEEAIEQYEKAIEIKEDFAIAIYNMGISFVQLEQYEQGIFFLQTAKGLFERMGDSERAYATEKYIQCGVLPADFTPNAKRAPMCKS